MPRQTPEIALADFGVFESITFKNTTIQIMKYLTRRLESVLAKTAPPTRALTPGVSAVSISELLEEL